MSSDDQPGRIAHYDWMRVLAMVAVVQIHSAARLWYRSAYATSEWRQATWLDAAVRPGLVVFFMLTGALFLNRSRPITAAQMWRRRIPRLLVSYLVWGLFYAWYVLWSTRARVDPEALVQLFPKPYYHLWFLPVIIGIYVVMPWLWQLMQSRSLARTFVVTGMAVQLVVALAKADEHGVVDRVLQATLPVEALGWAAMVVAGGLMASSTRCTPMWKPLFGYIACTAGTCWLTFEASKLARRPDLQWFSHLSPLVMVAGLCCFWAALQLAGKVSVPAWATSAVQWLAPSMFGVFLIHPVVLAEVERRMWMEWVQGPAAAVLLGLAIFAGSAALTSVLRRIPVLGEWLL